MKNKKTIYLLSLLLIVLVSTSCLDKGGYELSISFQPAVVKVQEDSQKLFILKNGDKIYSEKHDSDPNVEDGDCGIVDFTWNVSDPAHKVDSSFYTAATLSFGKLDKFGLKENISDTTKVYANEHVVTSFYNKSVLLENNLFLFTEHTGTFDLDSVDLSYNKNFVPEFKDGKRVYDLYFRLTGDTIKNSQKEIKYNVFDISNFIAEKSEFENEKGKDTLYFRVKYVSSIKTDSVPAWKTSPDFELFLPKK